jgi:hypothetical protein
VTLAEHHARRPDVHLALDRPAPGEPPALLERVGRTVGQASLGIELAVRGPQPMKIVLRRIVVPGHHFLSDGSDQLS